MPGPDADVLQIQQRCNIMRMTPLDIEADDPAVTCRILRSVNGHMLLLCQTGHQPGCQFLFLLPDPVKPHGLQIADRSMKTCRIRRIDRPVSKKYDVETIIEQLRQFHGHVIIQTMFLKGVAKLRSSEVENLDNTTDDFVLPWLEAVKTIAPEQVMIYTIDRETPVSYLQKASHEELNRIRDMVIAEGIPCTASY